MGFNTNVVIDVSKLINKIWPKFWGVLLVWALEIIIVGWIYEIINIEKPEYAIVTAISLLPLTFLIWVVQTKRWFQRTGYEILLHCLVIMMIGFVTYFFVYPYLIAGSKSDLVFIQYWLTAIVVIIFAIFSYLYVCKQRNGLCIVFMVSNQSMHEQDIMQALDEARNRVEEVANNIQIVIPPFGIAKTPKQCERYINSHFNQADALIFASLIDSPEGSESGYCFNRFTSMMSNRFVKKENQDETRVKMLMDESYCCHEWNTLNIHTDHISRQLEVAGNLSHLLLMYVSCIYLQKHKYSDAIDVADSLYTYNLTGNKRYDDAVRDMMAHSYLMAQYIEEYENQDYCRAHEILDECVTKMPQLKNTLAYDLSMARINFYNGDLKESKKKTKHAKSSQPNSEWYVATNMAFYAIYEKKPKEMVTYYKKMLKMHKQDRNEVEYAIKFLKIEASKTNDKTYLMGLYHGISFLLLYVDEKLSEKYLKQTKNYSRIEGYKELESMRELISSSKGKLKTR